MTKVAKPPALAQMLLNAAEGLLPPEQIGALVDELKKAEAARLAADKVAEALKAAEVTIKLTLIEQMRLAKVGAIGGTAFTATLSTDVQPTVKDWTKFYAYILKNKAFDLLERRPGKAAVKARWEDGKEVPGVDRFSVDKLSFTKLKG